MAKKRKKAPRRKTARTIARRTRARSFDLLDQTGEEAEPAQPTKRLLDNALRDARKGKATVIVKGMTRHHCQATLIPKFTELAEEAGLRVEFLGLGRLRAGDTIVLFQPLVTVGTESD